jgi:cyclophilin family peptidyl-prolyl cis-trans isomerase
MQKKLNDRLIIEVQKDHIARVACQLGEDHSTYNSKYFDCEIGKRKFNTKGIVAMANRGPNQNASEFFIQLSNTVIDSFYKKHTIFGYVALEESADVLTKINQVVVNKNSRPL